MMPQKSPKAANTEKSHKPISMHDNVQIWDDCCTCAAEPYWLEIGEQIEREEKQKIKDTQGPEE